MTTTLPPLPKMTYPSYETTLPYSKKKVKYRSFNTREQRSLLTAQENFESDVRNGKPVNVIPIVEAICDIIQSVSGIDPRKIPTIDMEYMILKCKACAVDSQQGFQFPDPETGETIKIKIDLNDFEAVIPEEFTTDLRLDENTILKMRLPTILDVLAMADNQVSKTDGVATVTANCIEKIYQGDAEYDLSQYTVEDKIAFLDELLEEQLAKIAEFFQNAPRMRRVIKYKRKDGTEKTLIIEGMNHFFK